MYRHGEWKHPSDLDPLAEDSVTGLVSVATADAVDIGGIAPRSRVAGAESPPRATAPQQIVFIEANVPDLQDLLDGLKPGAQAVVLDPDQDGVQQIAAYLASHDVQDLAGIDIVAHGADGTVGLGTATLDAGSIAGYQTELATIGAALAPGGAIQIYGCNVGEDAAGVAFLDQLSQATGGANIAAASHLVGDAAGGGSFDLNINVGTIDVATPFTSNALTSFKGELSLSTTVPQLYAVWSEDANGSTTVTRLEQIGINGTTFVSGGSIDLADASTLDINQLRGAAFDATLDRYFLSQAADLGADFDSAMLFEGTIGASAAPGTINISASSSIFYTGLAFDPSANNVYVAEQVYSGITSGSTTPLTSTIDGIGIYSFTPSANITAPVTPTLAIYGHSTITGGGTLQGPGDVAVVPNTNLLVFTDDQEAFLGNGSAHIDVGNLLSHQWTTLTIPGSIISTALDGAAALSVAVDATSATGGILFFTVQDGTVANNGIYSAGYTITGSGSTQSASLFGTITPLYTSAAADFPTDIVLDPVVNNGTVAGNGIFYTSSTNGTIYAGNMSGGGTLTAVGDLSGGSAAGESLDYESTPSITASGTTTFTPGGGAVSLNSGLTLVNTDGQYITSTTVTIGGFVSGDTLNVGTLDGLGSVFSNGSLILSGTTNATTYQTALDSITFNSSSTTGSRAITYAATDGVIVGTGTSNVTLAAAISLAASGTVSYTSGGAAAHLDSSATVTDTASITGATIDINTGYVTGDTLNYSAIDGITVVSNANGTLALGGAATAADYSIALDSITYSFAPSGGDPTDAGNDPSRTIDWNITDGGGTATATSTIDTTLSSSPLLYGQTIVEAGILAATETVSAGVMTLKNAGGTSVGTIDVGISLVTSDFTLTTISGNTDVIVDTVFGTYTSGVTLLTNPTTIAATGKVSNGVASGKAVTGPSGTNWTLTNFGTIAETGAGASSGISLAAAGTIINAGHVGGNATTNGGAGITLAAGGSVTNQSGGTISGYDGVGAGAAATVVNGGAIAGNNPYVTTVNTIVGSGYTYFNAYVQFSSLAAGVYLQAGGVITNQSGGSISGYDGVNAGAAATVVNTGVIAGLTAATAVSTTVSGGNTYFNTATYNPSLAAGVFLQAGGSVTNQSGGTITGDYGVKASGAPATVVNAGTIAGSYTNPNHADGVDLTAGGSVTNQAGGVIYAAVDGVLISGGRGTVINLGTIHSHIGGFGGRGVSLAAGGLIVNGAANDTTAQITGYNYAIQFGTTGTDTLMNYGTVYGPTGTIAVSMYTGTVVNGASGATGALIKSGLGANAVQIAGVGKVVNDGTINGNAVNGSARVDYGVSIGGNGSIASTISNLGTQALIQGYVAVYARNATVTNAGTMYAYQTFGGAIPIDAVVFGGGTNRLIIDPGAVFIGNVYGSGPVTVAPGGNTIVLGTANGVGTTTLELASGASAGTMSGLGTKYVGFAAVTIDAGANWTFSGANTLATGITLLDSGTLTDTGTFTNAGLVTGSAKGVILTTGAQVTNQSGGTITGSTNGISASGAGTVVNVGLISGNLTVTTGSGISFAAGGSVTNQSGGKITGARAISEQTGTLTVLNAGSITGGTGANKAGIALNGSATISNQSGGVITGNYGVIAYASGATVTNAGSISGVYGVLLNAVGRLTNQSGGIISGSSEGVLASATATMTNAGTITGGGYGVQLSVGGTLIAQSGGTISSTGTAVSFGKSHTSRLVVYQGASFTGLVDGGNTIGAASISTLELASSASAGTLTGLGSQFTHFAQVTVDAGAQWTLSGTQTGFATLTDAGTLLNGVSIGNGTFTVSVKSTGSISGTNAISASGTLSLVNSGAIAGNSASGDGVYAFSGGTVTNLSGGVISGLNGIYARVGLLSLVNAGVISGTTSSGISTGFGVTVRSGAVVTNQSGGTINGQSGLGITGAAGTVVNAGVIIGSSTAGRGGIYIAAGGTITNQIHGTISGTKGVYGRFTAATVINAGTITGNTASGDGVLLASGGYVSNQSTGTIVGSLGVLGSGGALTLLNAGQILGGTSSSGIDAVELAAGGSVTNQSGGTISGGSGIFGTTSAATVANFGSVAGVAIGGSGILLHSGGMVTNASTASISGYVGVNLQGAVSTLVNAGHITGNATQGVGAELFAGGLVSNQSGGTITGSSGVRGQTDPITVVNAGSIGGNATVTGTANSTGVLLSAGGVVTNQSGGVITGAQGINGGTAASTVVNYGQISGATSGTADAGVYLAACGSLTNQSAGSILGFYGVQAAGAATVVNAGSIHGSTVAVHFASSFTNRLVIDPGATFIGTVDGGNTIGAESISTLELASGASAGTLTGLGSKYINFAAATIDAGASWIFSGANTVVAGVTLTDSGTLTDTGTLINAGVVTGAAYGVIVATGARVTNQSGGTITGTADGITASGASTVVNAGLISGNPTAVGKAGLFLTGAGSVTNQSGGTITGLDGIYASAASTTILNLGDIAGNATHGTGIVLHAGGTVSNQSGGSITGTIGLLAQGSATIFNAGYIADSAGGVGAYLIGGDLLTNQSGGTVTGATGVYAGAVATVLNAGLIQGTASYAVYLDAGGTVTNLSGGTITGNYGIEVTGASGAVINAGTIAGGTSAGAFGVYLASGGTITNQSGGLISGTGNAVKFAAGYTDRLVIDPGATFSGTVNGGNTIGAGSVSTLELASGASAGTLQGFGSQYIDFAQITLDAGAQWDVTGTDGTTGLAGAMISGFTYGDTIDVTNFVATGSTFSGNELTLSSGASTITLDIQGSFITQQFRISGDGTAGTDIALQIALPYGTTIDEAGIVVASETVTAGVMTLFNAVSAAVGTITVGTSLSTGDFLLRSDGSGGTDLILNAVFGTYTSGVTLLVDPTTINGTATVSNTAASGSAIGGLAGTAWSVSNLGTITETGVHGYGISLGSGGTVVNSGGITAAHVAVYLGGAGSVTNQSDGTINATATAGYGIHIIGVGNVTNNGTIQGSSWLIGGQASLTVTNTGLVLGSGASNQGVHLRGGGLVTNSATGTINAGSVGVYIGGSSGTVINSGVIETSGRWGVYLLGGTVANAGLIGSAGVQQAIYIFHAGDVTNLANGTIAGETGIAFGQGFNDTLIDSGTIIGTGGTAVAFGNRTNLLEVDPGATFVGTVTGGNAIDGPFVSTLELASGSTAGTLSSLGTQYVDFAQVTIDTGANWTLSGTSTLVAGATLTNSGTLTDSGTFTNAGLVSGADEGILLTVDASLTNQSGGTISGDTYGIYVSGGTVTNAGTIESSLGTAGVAVEMAGDGTRLIDDPGAAFIGAINGGSGVMELASADSAGTISGFGTSITNFGSLVFDTGAQWTVTGNDSANGLGTLGINGFTFGDTIDLTGFAAVNRTFTSNTLVLGDGVGDYDTLRLHGTFTTRSVATNSDGSGGTDITLQTVLSYAETIDEAGIVAASETVTAGVMTLFNAGSTAVGTITVGTSLSTGDFSLASDGAGGTDVIVHTATGTYTSGITLLVNPTTIGSVARISDTVASGIGVAGPVGTTWTVTNLGTVTESGTGSIGVSLAAAGTITNAAAAVIAGSAVGIYLKAGGVVTNASGGTISGAKGIYVKTAAGTVVNAGSIIGNATSVTGNGISLALGGLVSNHTGGVISGDIAIYVKGASGTVVNYGDIAGGAIEPGYGVLLSNGGTVTNQAGGTISGYRGIQAFGAAATVVNSGLVTSDTTFGKGVYLADGGAVTNHSGATITGSYGVFAVSQPITVVNAGSIHSMRLSKGGLVTNQADGAIISGFDGVYEKGNPLTLVNAGSLGATSAYGTGAYLAGGGQVTNQSGGVIFGGYAIRNSALATVTNSGSIGGNATSGAGVYFSAGGTLSNQSGGTITAARGVFARYAAVTVVNAGSIIGNATTANGRGVTLGAGGLVSNQAGGVITGLQGVYIGGATGSVANAGSIGGNTATGVGVYLDGGGTITDLAGGTISGGVDAVKFAASQPNRLVIDPDAVFTGTVNGGNTIGAASISTLELASGASAGTLSGLGSEYINFAQTTIDAGADWIFSGTNTLVSGATLTNSGTLTDTGTLINGGTLDGNKLNLSGASLTNLSSGLVASAYVYGVAAGGTDTIVNQGTITNSAIIAVYLAAAGNVSNAAGALISGYDAAVKLKGTDATLTNLGQITATSTNAGDYGVYLRNGGLITNGQGGSGTSTASIQGYSGIAFKTVDTVNAYGTLTNYGTVLGTRSESAGALLSNAGTVINGPSGATGALIEGGRYGISNDQGPVINDATIIATGTLGGDYGVAIEGVGSVSNLGTAALIDGYGGVLIGTDGTVTNAGTIESNQGASGVAVRFTDGNTRLIDDPGAVFIGSIYGGSGGTAVLELASGSSAGTISGLGTSVTNFTSLVFDAGAQWTVAGNDSANGLGTLGISGFTAGDTIELTGIDAINRTFASNTLVLGDGIGDYQTLHIQGTFSTANFKLSSDGSGDTEVTYQNPPTLVAGGTATFIGGGSAVTLDSGLTISDTAGTILASGTVFIGSGFISGDILNFGGQSGISGSFDSSTGTLTLTGTASLADYQTALDSITYSVSPSDGDPTDGGSDLSRTIDWVVSDGTAVSTPATSTLDVTHVAPTITASGTVSYAAGGTAAVLDPSITVGDSDSDGMLTGGTVAITAGTFDDDGGVLNADTAGTAISFSYNATTEVLTLSGTDTLADYQAVLASVSFDSTAPDPTNAGDNPTRTVTWTVNDGVDSSSSATSTLYITREPPVIGGTAEGQATTDEAALDPFAAVTITDPNAGQTESVTITLSDAANGTLSNLDGGTFNNGTYVVTGTTLAVTGAIDSLVFTPSAHQVAPGSTVTTSFTIKATDSNGVSATDSTTTVIATAANDTPEIAGTAVGQPTTDAATLDPFSAVSISDVDVGQTETVTITLSSAGNGTLSNLDGGSYDSSTGVYSISGTDDAVTAAVDGLVFTPTAHEVAPGSTITTTFSIHATDTAGGTSSDSATTVIATAANDQPVIANAVAGQATTDEAALSPFSGVSIGDVDFGQTETVTITLSNSANGALSNLAGGSYNSSTGVYSVTGTDAAVTSAMDGLVFTPTAHQMVPGSTVTTTFTIKATDTAGGTSSDGTTSVIATAVNDPAAFVGTLGNTGVPIILDTSVTATPTPFSALSVVDPDVGHTDTVTITLSNPEFASVTNLGGGSYDSATGIYSVTGTPDVVTAAIDGLEVIPEAVSSTTDGYVASTDVTIALVGPGGGPIALTPILASEVQVLGPASTPADQVSTSVSADGTDFAPPVDGMTNEAVVTSPTTGGAYSVPAGYQAAFLGGSTNATLQDTSVGNAVLVGNTGNDLLIGGAGNDSIVAGNGNNTLVGGSGTVALAAGNGNDSITTSADSTYAVTLGGGIDTVFADGSGTITGGSGSDLIDAAGTGDSATDLIVSQGLQDTVIGGAGGLTVTDDGMGDTIVAGSGASAATLAGTGAWAVGTTGSLTVTDAAANNSIVGGIGGGMTSVTITAAGAAVFGTAGPINVLDAGSGALIGTGDAGNITITGGNASVFGGTGSLVVTIGGAGALVDAEAASTTVDASSAGATQASVFGGYNSVASLDGSVAISGGADALMVGTGGSNTTINAGAGSDSVFIGTGNMAGSNVITAGSGPLLVDFIGGAGSATVFGGTGHTSLFGTAGTDVTYQGSGGGALLYAGGADGSAETLDAAGSTSNDTLFAAHGNVSLVAGSGDDLLIAGDNTGSLGGAGSVVGGATLAGGSGQDLFDFSHAFSDGADVITNFTTSDIVFLGGYDTLAGGAAASETQATKALQNATQAGGNTTIALADGTTITFVDTTTAQLQGHMFSN